MISKEELDQARAQRDATRRRSQLAADLATARLGGATMPSGRRRRRWNRSAPPWTRRNGRWTRSGNSRRANAAVQDTLYRQGEFVAAGSPVVVLLPPENIKVRFFVPQEQLPRIKTGGKVSVYPDGAAHPFHAAVNYISPQAEYTPPVIFSRETRANLVFMIEAKFSPADAADLRPGQPVDVELRGHDARRICHRRARRHEEIWDAHGGQ